MKYIRLILWLSLFSHFSAVARDPPATAEQLRVEVESALKARDTNAFKALFQLEGVSEKMKALTARTIPYLVTNDIATVVKLSPLPPTFRPTNEINGIRYIPSVSVVGLLEVKYTKTNNFMSVPYGKKGGAFYLSCAIEEKIAASAIPDVPLAIWVTGTLTPDANQFSGSYVYVVNGKEVADEISGKGNLSKSFWGGYIKSCTVHKTAGPSGIKLVISESNKTVFESREIETQDPITYQRKP